MGNTETRSGSVFLCAWRQYVFLCAPWCLRVLVAKQLHVSEWASRRKIKPAVLRQS